jgi:molybdenum cofactor cytidylyltransferase
VASGDVFSPNPSALRVGAVLLAAGSGSRLGGRPKSLLELDGVALIRRAIAALAQAGVCDLVVVLGHHARLLEPALQGTAARWVVNPQPEEGQVSSQRLGLAALDVHCEAVVVALADQPLINAQAVLALLQAFAQRPVGTQMLQPSVKGLPGNPVVFSSTVMKQILESGADMGARQWQKAHPQSVYHWEIPHVHYRLDVDNEADRQAVEQLTGQSLRWPHDLNR